VTARPTEKKRRGEIFLSGGSSSDESHRGRMCVKDTKSYSRHDPSGGHECSQIPPLRGGGIGLVRRGKVLKKRESTSNDGQGTSKLVVSKTEH